MRDTYSLMVARAGTRGKTRTEWLPGKVWGTWDEVASEATALIDDPRDTIQHVFVWSTRRAQFTSRVFRKGANG